jgi:hypothetical protein
MGKKKLCTRIEKNILKKNIEKYLKKVDSAEYICLKCGRVANSEDSLCVPKSIKSF